MMRGHPENSTVRTSAGNIDGITCYKIISDKSYCLGPYMKWDIKNKGKSN